MQTKVAQRSAPKATAEELEHGIPLFLEQLIKTLELEQTSEPMLSRKIQGPLAAEMPVSLKWEKRRPSTGGSY